MIKMSNIAVENIGPEKALEYLENMEPNRRVSDDNMHKIANDMVDGEYLDELAYAIRLDTHSRLIDGQHRLWAIVESGKTFDFLVVRNLPTSSMDHIDKVLPRRVGDNHHRKGEKNASLLAASLNLYNTFLESGIVMRSGGYKSLTTTQSDAFLRDNPDIRLTVSKSEALRKVFKGHKATWATIYYILRLMDKEDADGFMTKVRTGEDLKAGNPIFALRSRLIADMSAIRRLQPREYSALILKAWNLWRDGRSNVQVLTWKIGGENPEAYPKPH